ncbi:MAG: hypothetical protein IKX25_08055 [Bacteroidales bacterium]|nr:hypothetical protein [Bacteroidales bacterium]
MIMVTIYSNENSRKSALAASQQIKNVVYESCLSFEKFKMEMKTAIERDLQCVKEIKW